MEVSSFTKEMRKATRDVHAVSDALVNAKLLFALSHNDVWADGLLIFYEIFRFLEEAMTRHPSEYLGQFNIENMSRTEAFQQDLSYYLGDNWQSTYDIRPEVADYLLHLQKLEREDSDLLIAYIYHLYLGLLSGAQLLIRKKQIKDKFLGRKTKGQYAVTQFNDVSISNLKKEIKEIMEDVAAKMSDEKRKRILEESRNVFEWNNKIIRTVRGANRVLFEMLVFAVFGISLVYLLVRYFY